MNFYIPGFQKVSQQLSQVPRVASWLDWFKVKIQISIQLKFERDLVMLLENQLF